MALSSTGVFEVRTTGSDSSAGYFNPSGSSPGTDWSQQDAAQITIDGATISASVHTTTTQINVTGTSVSAAWNRNGLRITGGTATAGLYEITAVDTVNNRITVDRSAGTSTQTVTGAVGGALASPGQAGAFLVTGNTVWVKSGTYSMTSSSNVSGGRITLGSSQNLYGYESSRGDWGAPPYFQAAANSVTCVTSNAGNPSLTRVRNIKAGRSPSGTETGVNGFANSASGGHLFRDCIAYRCSGTGFNMTASSFWAYGCVADSCSLGFTFGSSNGAGTAMFCAAVGCTNGFLLSPGTVSFCVAANCTGYGFSANSQGWASNCTAYGCQDGFTVGLIGTFWASCVAYGNTRYGFNVNSVTQLLGCAAGASGTIDVNGTPYENTGFITLTADPFTDAANDDFTLNSAAGGGALLKGTGYPSSYPGLPGTNYPDIGAFQSQASAGSSGARLVGPSAIVTPGGCF